MNPFLQKLNERPLLGDGAMGTILFARGASSEQCLEQLVVSHPGWVTEIHQAYAAAGADAILIHSALRHATEVVNFKRAWTSTLPVIAVPTSIGYGASFQGLAALLAMLNSCANGVSVVNIDNGFGAGCIASLINHLPPHAGLNRV